MINIYENLFLSFHCSCIVHGPSFYYLILTPIGLVILFNICVLCRIIYAIKMSAQRFKNQNNQTDKLSANLKMIRIACTCTCIMGLTWVLGAFALGDATVLFQWLFAVFNSLQGLFIFIFHVARNTELRQEISAYYFRKRHDRKRSVSPITSKTRQEKQSSL